MMFSLFNIIDKMIENIYNILNTKSKSLTFKCSALSVYDYPVYGKLIANEKCNSYKKRLYYWV